jgi:uncharacterized protein YdcH (DUF465 family)
MRSRTSLVIVAISLGVNLVLAFGWFLAAHNPPPRWSLPVATRPIVTNILRPIRTNLVLQAPDFSWGDIESTNYTLYIDNLRGFGCPEPTVRDIIVADVNTLFAHRRATEIVTPSQQWWRATPDPKVVAEAQARLTALDAERRELLTKLLGPAWATSGAAMEFADATSTFDGPVLGEISAETKRAVQDIERAGRDRLQAALAAAEGKPLSAAETARLRQQTRDALAQVLTPAQLEEYLLRFSNQADQLRGTLRGLSTTPDEFRSLFQATDSLDAELQRLAGATDAASVQRRQELEQQRTAALQNTLGRDRFAFYQLNQDAGFQQARDTAQTLGAAAETVLPLYQINQATAQEKQRILDDASLTPEEQSEELAAIQQQRLDALRKLLGEEGFRKLQGGTP